MEGELEQLKHQVGRLTELVWAQQRRIERQEEELETVKAATEDESVIREMTPLQCQTLGFGDLRLFGAFDARFHSTHK